MTSWSGSQQGTYACRDLFLLKIPPYNLCTHDQNVPLYFIAWDVKDPGLLTGQLKVQSSDE